MDSSVMLGDHILFYMYVLAYANIQQLDLLCVGPKLLQV